MYFGHCMAGDHGKPGPYPDPGRCPLRRGVVSVPAALLARTLGLQGGCFTLDAACASSLFAIKLACDQLARGRADMMIAGGVSRPDSLYTQIGFTQLKALSPSGRCAPFDRQADGLVVGEGTGMVVLKRMSDALACGDIIHGVITGAGWSNDIGGNLVAPASDGQIRAMAAACKQAGWSPGDVQHIECHGSATPVGDGVELNSMKTLWENAGVTGTTCAIGSVKSMVGHLLTAAGAAGFIKTLMAMKARQLPPSLNFATPPENSPLNESPFRVQTMAEPWIPQPLSGDKSLPPLRRAGVSAFGFGGINAHVLVEEFRKELPTYYYTAGTVAIPETAVAIVGMALITPRADTLDALTHLMIAPENARPSDEATLSPDTGGWWLDEIHTFAGEFHLPPNQIPDLLPQHLVMLKAALAAMKDAGIPPRQAKGQAPRTRFGGAIGIEFDHGATDFHLGWRLKNDDNHTRFPGLGLVRPPSESGIPESGSHKASSFPPLTFNRTLGALGGIVASRIAREFQLGGPCFTLSADTASGMKALEVGMNTLKAGEADLFLCGAVDMAGDLRQALLDQCLTSQEQAEKRAAENAPKGHPSVPSTPSEGAAAVVLKPLAKAMADGDKIYSVITAATGTCGGEMAAENPSATPALGKAYETSLETALAQSKLALSNIDFYMVHDTGISRTLEWDILQKLHRSPGNAQGIPGVGSSSCVTGRTFGISGLVSVIQASLGLYHGLRPALFSFAGATNSFPSEKPAAPASAPWIPRSTEGNGHACVASITRDGACGHVILKAPPTGPAPLSHEHREKSSPVTDTGKTLPQENGHYPNIPANITPENIIRLEAHRFPCGHLTTQGHFKEKGSLSTHRFSHAAVSGTQRSAAPDTEYLQGEKKKAHPAGDPKQTRPSDPWMKGNPATNNGLVPDNGSVTESNPGASTAITARAHMKFLELSQKNTQAFETQFKALTRLASAMVSSPGNGPEEYPAFPDIPELSPENPQHRENSRALSPPMFDRHQCLTFAVDTAGKVLGEKFDIIDTYPVRVRLPDEPLMLVDRILSIQGEMRSMGPGKIVTQHDVKGGAWYLDGDKAPVSISIEAGQADLFLCSWLGIDHQVKGQRRYRLLDAKVTFHRPLPCPGETLEYHIEIDRFLKQGEVYLFFFHYKGYIDNTLFISMRDGCAGFFTPQEVKNSGGIILKKENTCMEQRSIDFELPVPMKKESYGRQQVESLRQGDLTACFGPLFKGILLGRKLRLPDGRMHLIDRVLAVDPRGGRFGLGSITAEADIHPDDWFLTCHFVDDKVMPGTLMYECCAHALRIFTQRMGWISPRDDVHYDIIPGLESDLKCRGPVTPETRKARYEIEVKEMGYHPEPFVVADAHMFSDDHRIVLYKNMGMKLVGLSRREIELFWSHR